MLPDVSLLGCPKHFIRVWGLMKCWFELWFSSIWRNGHPVSLSGMQHFPEVWPLVYIKKHILMILCYNCLASRRECAFLHLSFRNSLALGCVFKGTRASLISGKWQMGDFIPQPFFSILSLNCVQYTRLEVAAYGFRWVHLRSYVSSSLLWESALHCKHAFPTAPGLMCFIEFMDFMSSQEDGFGFSSTLVSERCWRTIWLSSGYSSLANSLSIYSAADIFSYISFPEGYCQ